MSDGPKVYDASLVEAMGGKSAIRKIKKPTCFERICKWFRLTMTKVDVRLRPKHYRWRERPDALD